MTTPFEPGVPSARGFQALVGYEVRRVEGGAQVWLEVGDQHLNSGGFGHGGVTLTLLDTAGGFTVYYEVQPERVVTLNLATQFLAPVPRGTVVATCRLERVGGTVAHASISLHEGDPDGPLLATAVAAYRVFRKR